MTYEPVKTPSFNVAIAFRPEAARLKGLAPPEDPLQHTRLKDPNEPLHFSFPDLDGKVVSDRDARFQGQVVLVNEHVCKGDTVDETLKLLQVQW